MSLKELYLRYKDVIKYVFFGGLTTVINVVVYYLFFDVLRFSNTFSVIIAWILSVAFAFVTNKLFVFESKSWERKVAVKELGSFLFYRIATGVLDLVIMYLTVDILNFNGTLMKIISNVLVIILNYIASKLIIFKKNKAD